MVLSLMACIYIFPVFLMTLVILIPLCLWCQSWSWTLGKLLWLIWAAPSAALLEESSSSAAASSSSVSAAALPPRPLAVHGQFKTHWPVLKAMARLASTGVSNANLLQLLKLHGLEPDDSKNLYVVALAAVWKFGGDDLTELDVLEIMATRHFDKLSEDQFVDASFC